MWHRGVPTSYPLWAIFSTALFVTAGFVNWLPESKSDAYWPTWGHFLSGNYVCSAIQFLFVLGMTGVLLAVPSVVMGWIAQAVAGVICYQPALLLALLITTPASATDRYFFDITEFSSDGKLRFEAKSPDNAGKVRQPFAKNFEYTLYDVATSKVIWTRKQAKREGPPGSAFVDRDRRVVVLTGYGTIMLFDAQGEISLKLHVLEEALPADDVKTYVSETSAGPRWSGKAHLYFFVAGERTYFSIRTWWDRRIIVSLDAAKQVADERILSEAAAQSEKTFALTILRKGAEIARKWADKKLPEYSHHVKEPWDEVKNLRTVIHFAGRMEIKEAAPFLHDIEKIPCFNSTSSASEKVPEGKLMVGSYSSDDTRRNVQLALRRIGAKPAGYPATEMKIAGKESMEKESYRPRKHNTPRAERVASIIQTMEAKEVVDTIGEPDYIHRQGLKFGEADWAWDYDIDAEKPYTFRVNWKDGNIVSREKIQPPVWKDRMIRDRQD